LLDSLLQEIQLKLYNKNKKCLKFKSEDLFKRSEPKKFDDNKTSTKKLNKKHTINQQIVNWKLYPCRAPEFNES